MKYKALAALTLLLSLSTGASYAVDGFTCPLGSSQVSTGAYSTPSCVGSNSQGLVEQTLPFSNYNYLGTLTARETNRIFALPERAAVKDSPVYPRPIGNIAANDTFSSARDSLIEGIPGKLLADWTFLYEGPRAGPGSRIAWMGGVLWHKPDGTLLFSTDAADAKSDLWISMTPYRRDIRGFLSAAGATTARLFAEQYGIDIAAFPGVQLANAARWDAAMNSKKAPGTTVLLGLPQAGGEFATLVFGSNGFPSHVIDPHGERMEIEQFYCSTLFTSITGRGIAATR